MVLPVHPLHHSSSPLPWRRICPVSSWMKMLADPHLASANANTYVETENISLFSATSSAQECAWGGGVSVNTKLCQGQYRFHLHCSHYTTDYPPHDSCGIVRLNLDQMPGQKGGPMKWCQKNCSQLKYLVQKFGILWIPTALNCPELCSNPEYWHFSRLSHNVRKQKLAI